MGVLLCQSGSLTSVACVCVCLQCMCLRRTEKVVEVSLEHLEEWGGREVMKDPRFELVVGDAYAWIKDCMDKFDCIIMDISDPIEAGPGIMLYTKELYEHLTTVLTPNGVFVTQAGAADSIPLPHAVDGERDTNCFCPIRNTLKEVFSCVLPYTHNIPSFGGDWGYVMAFNNSSDTDGAEEWKRAKPETINGLLEQLVNGGESSLKMYDGITHQRMFHLTKGKPQTYFTNYDFFIPEETEAYSQQIFSHESHVFLSPILLWFYHYQLFVSNLPQMIVS